MEESNRLEQQKKLDEERQKRETQERKAKELKSANEIRKVQQKVRAATANNFEEVRKELEAVLQAQLPNTGEKRQQTLEDSEKILEQAEKRVEVVLQQRRREEEQKREEARQRLQREEAAERLRNELYDLVELAEKGVSRARAGACDLAEEAEPSFARVEVLAADAEAAAAEAVAQAARCSEFFRQHRSEMLPAPRPEEAGEKEQEPRPRSDDPFDKEPVEPKKLLGQLLQRVNSCKREAEAATVQTAEARVVAEARAAALARTQELQALFRRYDKDSDEMLSRRELQAYAKGEFELELADDTLNFIWESHAEYSAKHGDRGIVFGSFQLARVAVGIEREMRRDRHRHAERQVKEEKLAKMKAEMQDNINSAIERVTEADEALTKAEESVKPLPSKSKSLPVSEMLLLADQVDELLEAAKACVSSAKEGMGGLRKDDTENGFKSELRSFLDSETKKHDSKLGRMEGRMKRVGNVLAQFRDDARRKRAEDMDRVRSAALRLARYQQQHNRLSPQDMFRRIDVGGDGTIDKEDFVTFFETVDKVIRAVNPNGAAEGVEDAEGSAAGEALPVETVDFRGAELAAVFPSLCAEGETSISEERFEVILALHMLVVKESAMTDGPNIKDSQVLRRLELDEVVEVTWGPTRERDAGVLRVRVRAKRDGTEGWVTTVGNAGTVFLREGGRCFTTLKETPVSKAFATTEAKAEAEPVVLLKPGDEVDVEEWPKKETESGSWRMRVRLKGEGTSGWVTSVDCQGTVFLKVT